MKLSHFPSGFNTDISDENPTVVFVEKPSLMAEYVNDLKSLMEDNEGDFCLYEGEKELSFSKSVELIIDPWAMNYNSKRIRTRFMHLINEVAREQLNKQFLEVRSGLFVFMEELQEHIPYSISYNDELDIEKMIKLLDVQVEHQDHSLAEKIIEYIKMMASLCFVKVFFLVNISAFLSVKEIEQIYRDAIYAKVALVLFESVQRRHISGEKGFIIDNEKCIIEL